MPGFIPVTSLAFAGRRHGLPVAVPAPAGAAPAPAAHIADVRPA